MLIGAMNHPGRPVADEIEWIAALNLDFIDLTLEPPLAAVWNTTADGICDLTAKKGLQIVGHTPYYLPFASPFESIRLAAIEEARRCIAMFAKVGAAWMNLHPDGHAPLHSLEFVIDRNLDAFGTLLETARDEGVGLMVENLPGDFSTVPRLAQLLEPLPELGLHLDIGHANLSVPANTSEQILAAYSGRLRHVHLHDNKGGSADLHLPLGSGTMDIARCVRALKASGYDGTITLEVFSPDRHYLAHSRDVLQKLWNSADS